MSQIFQALHRFAADSVRSPVSRPPRATATRQQGRNVSLQRSSLWRPAHRRHPACAAIRPFVALLVHCGRWIALETEHCPVNRLANRRTPVQCGHYHQSSGYRCRCAFRPHACDPGRSLARRMTTRRWQAAWGVAAMGAHPSQARGDSGTASATTFSSTAEGQGAHSAASPHRRQSRRSFRTSKQACCIERGRPAWCRSAYRLPDRKATRRLTICHRSRLADTPPTKRTPYATRSGDGSDRPRSARWSPLCRGRENTRKAAEVDLHHRGALRDWQKGRRLKRRRYYGFLEHRTTREGTAARESH